MSDVLRTPGAPTVTAADETPDVLVLGGGPAGMTAALSAAEGGAHVVVLESTDELGGQYWRHLPAVRPSEHEDKLHHGFGRFQQLRQQLADHPRCELLLEAQVWAADRRDGAPPRLHVLVGTPDGAGRQRRRFVPAALILATGAHERTLPFPGWDLPGVFSGGAAQALAKGERVSIGQRVVVAGAGPFLLPVAASLVRAHATVAGVFEASSWSRLARGWSPRPWQLLPARSKAGELTGYLQDLARHRIPYRTATAVTAAHGSERVEAVTVSRIDESWAPIPGTERRIAVDAVCVSHGFVPRNEIAGSAGCALDADGSVVVDDRQLTSVPGVYAVGELTGIGGVDLAQIEGEVAGRCAVGLESTAPQRSKRLTYQRFAQRLEAAHGIRPGWTKWASDETTICRCEEVDAGEMRQAASLTAAQGLRSLKLTTRAGLGICQGRMCSRSVEDIFIDAMVTCHGREQASTVLLDAGRPSSRPVVTPVRLGDIASSRPGQTPAEPNTPAPELSTQTSVVTSISDSSNEGNTHHG